MAYSIEADIYLALYSSWISDVRPTTKSTPTGRGPTWRRCPHLAVGVQLGRREPRPAPGEFASDEAMAKLDRVRAAYDPDGRFHSWMGRSDGRRALPRLPRRRRRHSVRRFFNPKMAALPRHVATHSSTARRPIRRCSSSTTPQRVADEGYHQTERRLRVAATTAAIQVSVRTEMPGVTPAMWTWWFGWHGSDPAATSCGIRGLTSRRRWADSGGQGSYLGRTSIVREYLGSSMPTAAIQFVAAVRAGPHQVRDAVAICARLGSADLPVDIGWLIHHIRRPPTGPRCVRGSGWAGRTSPFARPRAWPTGVRPIRRGTGSCRDPRDLMVHCAQEMNHLAGFLPELYDAVRQRVAAPGAGLSPGW